MAILINAGFIIAETAIRTSKSSDHKINVCKTSDSYSIPFMRRVAPVQAYEEAFLTFYTIEVLSKIASLGFKHYLRSAYNRYINSSTFTVVILN